MDMYLRTLLVLCCAVVGNVVSAEKVITCYYGTWATYRTGLGKFDVANVNTELCTHVIYTFVGIDNQGMVISLDSYLDLETGRDNFRLFNALKQKNPNLKTILAVGGWNEGSSKYSEMAANSTLRQNFIQSGLKMVLDYGFDGFDLDWEYPNKRDTVHGTADIDNFSQLCKELREEFDKYGLLLTAAVAPTKDNVETSYDIPAISKYLDFIHVMTYDMHIGSEPQTGYNSPLYRSAADTGDDEDLYTIDASIKYWIQEGCPPAKILLGLPFYGHSFTLADANNNTVGADSSGPGIAGPYTATNGTVGYNEFCVQLQNETGWDVRRDELARVPYAVKDLKWVSYDDPQSIIEKVNYSQQLGLGGVMMWSIETDDFHGLCGETYGLLKAINRAFGNEVSTEPAVTEDSADATTASSNADTEVPSASTSAAEVSEEAATGTVAVISTSNQPTGNTQEANEVNMCKEEGIVANPKDCSSFIMCVDALNGNFESYILQCPKNLHWDSKAHTCNYPEHVQCSV